MYEYDHAQEIDYKHVCMSERMCAWVCLLVFMCSNTYVSIAHYVNAVRQVLEQLHKNPIVTSSSSNTWGTAQG